MEPDRTVRKLGLLFAALGTAFLITGGLLLVYMGPMGRFGEPVLVLLAVFAPLGIAFFTAGAVILAIHGAGRRRMSLVDTGEPVQAQIIDVEHLPGLQMNGRTAHRVVCRYDEGGVAYLCRSRYLWFNPTSMLRSDTVTVYRDPRKPKRYYVDLSRVLPPTVEL